MNNKMAMNELALFHFCTCNNCRIYYNTEVVFVYS